MLECINALASIRKDFLARKCYVQPNIIKFSSLLTNNNSLFKKKNPVYFHYKNLISVLHMQNKPPLTAHLDFVYMYICYILIMYLLYHLHVLERINELS